MQFEHTTFDGCWWPGSDDPAAELPVLVPVLDRAPHGPVQRVLLSAAGWTNRPHGVAVAGRRVSIGYFAGQSPRQLIAICADGHVLVMHVDPAPGVREETDAWESEGGRMAYARGSARACCSVLRSASVDSAP
jgi:hypothetical protein